MEKNLDQIEINTDNNLTLDYHSRGLDICGVCKLVYNVGDRIPRIIVNCGHTYCTNCLSKYYRKNRIRCPFCKKLVKNLESVEQLPLNINIFSEVVQTNNRLLDMLDVHSDNSYDSLCKQHIEKQKHFYCSFHKTNFCRECIKLFHRDDKCCVVDLYDINKLYQLHEQNQYKNFLIMKSRSKAIGEKKIRKEEFFIAHS
jgi:hypothetical protein